MLPEPFDRIISNQSLKENESSTELMWRTGEFVEFLTKTGKLNWIIRIFCGLMVTAIPITRSSYGKEYCHC